MAANNIDPIYTGIPDIQWGSTDGDGQSSGALKTANITKNGNGTVLTVFTAGANGGYVSKIRFRATGTNSSATVARIFINNGGTNTTVANNVLYDELTLSATTLSETAALQPYELSMNIALPAGYKILVTISTAATAGYYVSCIGGSYTQSA